MTTLRSVINATATHYGLTAADLLAYDKRPRMARPRQVAMALCYEMPRTSLPALALAFHRDHTTVLHGVRAVEARAAADPELRAAMDAIRAKLEGQG